MTFKKKPFKLGNSVRFKAGQKDEDSGIDISGWQGRIIEIDETNQRLLVALDSVTLKSLSHEYLEDCEEKGLGWPEYYIGFDDVEPARPRDTKGDVEDTIADLQDSLGWVYLGEEGREINAILSGTDPDNEFEQMEAWEDHLHKVLHFPFEARVDEWQEPGSALKTGAGVKVLGIHDMDEWYGLLVKVRHGRRTLYFPLCDLKAVDENSPNHDPVQLYAVWFANR